MTSQPSYLLELLDPPTGELVHVDLFLDMSRAVEAAYTHVVNTKASVEDVDVSIDKDEELEGIGFFDKSRNLIACVTVYRLERDTEVASNPDIQKACSASIYDLQASLKKLF